MLQVARRRFAVDGALVPTLDEVRREAAVSVGALYHHFDAGTALRLGLVQEVVEHDRLLAAADEWCSRIANLPPHAVAMTKPLLRATADADWNAALTLEEFAEPTCFTTAAFAESVQAMLK